MPTVKPKVKRRRRRKKHYITGIHRSPKCKTPIEYRSGWELSVCLVLDCNDLVKSYEYESLAIPYVRAGKVHLYYPDFLIRYATGRTVLVEVKRTDKLTNRVVIAKAAAARAWISEQKNGWEYEFWTDKLIAGFKKLLEAKNIR